MRHSKHLQQALDTIKSNYILTPGSCVSRLTNFREKYEKYLGMDEHLAHLYAHGLADFLELYWVLNLNARRCSDEAFEALETCMHAVRAVEHTHNLSFQTQA